MWDFRTRRARAVGAVLLPAMVLGVIVLVAPELLTGKAAAEPLKDVHQGTVADCDGGVEWHFVHNRTEATSGRITVGDQVVANGPPFTSENLHYWVHTAGNVLPAGVSDNVDGGKLVLSHYTCDPTETTTTSTTTTSTTSTSSTSTSTTTSTKTGSSTTTSPSTTVATTTSTPKLAFSGPRDSLPLVIVGIVLLDLGYLAATAARPPRRRSI